MKTAKRSRRGLMMAALVLGGLGAAWAAMRARRRSRETRDETELELDIERFENEGGRALPVL
ncbi:MAG: hypothetical protein WC273_10255 [Dehalococcoidia bacterium]